MTTAMLDDRQYALRRAWIADYFDRTASKAWADLTSDAPVGRVRRSVRAGRDRMRHTLLRWLPANLSGARILDAGCGTGALSIELARRGARVVGIDLSPTLIALARERAPSDVAGRIEFCDGDMLDEALGAFDDVVAMDSLIHYDAPNMLTAVDALRRRANRALLFTIAPRTPLLAAMHAVGRVFPRGSRAPSIQPVSLQTVTSGVASLAGAGWGIGRSTRVSSGFYTSQAFELRHVHGSACSRGGVLTMNAKQIVSCRVDLEATHEHFHAHVDLGAIHIQPGDMVYVHGTPSRIPFGERRAFDSSADIERAGLMRRLWTRLVGRFGFQDLYDVGFEG